MKKKILFLLLLTSNLFCIDFNGDFELFFTEICYNKRDFFEGLNFQKYYGYNELKILLDDTKTNRFYLEDRIRYDFINNIYTNSLDQAYVLISPTEIFSFKLGRQRIDFGVGYLWSAVNNIDKPKDIYNPTKYKFGVDGIKTSFDLTKFLNLPSNLSFCVVLTTNIFSSDLSKSKFGLQTYSLLFENLEFGFVSSYNKQNSDNYLVGIYTSYDLKGFILAAEYALNLNKDKNFSQVLINLNKRISQKSFLLTEYFYNENGYDNKNAQQLYETIKSSSDYIAHSGFFIPGYFSKNYLFLSLTYEMLYDIYFCLNILTNLDSFGMFLYPKISFERFENISLSIEFIKNIVSSKKDEFYFLPHNYLYLLRINYYF